MLQCAPCLQVCCGPGHVSKRQDGSLKVKEYERVKKAFSKDEQPKWRY
jgi:hypothetical protein